MSTTVTPAARGRNPFDTMGVRRGDDGIARYAGRPASLVEMLRATVDRNPDGTAIAEVGGETLNHAELWDRAARVAGGLGEAGVDRNGDRAGKLRPPERQNPGVSPRASAAGLNRPHADVAQLVERRLPKPKVAGSRPVVRLEEGPGNRYFLISGEGQRR